MSRAADRASDVSEGDLLRGQRTTYRLVHRLGTGGFGQVWLAQDNRAQRVAIKVFQSAQAHQLAALRQVCHPNVVDVLDWGPDFLVLLCLDGPDLAEAEPLGGRALVQALTEAADGLGALHAADVVHGDVKPANLMHHGDRVVLIDPGGVGPHGGTPGFAAPERLRGAPPSASADVYALGVTARLLAEGTVPSWLDALIHDMTQRDARLRPTAEAVARQLADHGGTRAEPGVEQVRRRMGRTHLHRAGIDDVIDTALEQGQDICITGPTGTGRTHLLRQVQTRLQARGTPTAWLCDGVLPPPNTWILADDVDADRNRGIWLQELSRRGHSFVAVRAVADDAVHLRSRPLDHEESSRLLEHWLGHTHGMEVFLDAVAPGPLLTAAFLARACATAVNTGAIAYRDHAWRVVRDLVHVDTDLGEQPTSRPPAPHREVFAAVACAAGPASTANITQISQGPDTLTSLSWLRDHGWLAEADGQWVALVPATQRPDMHRRWIALLTARPPWNPTHLTHHLAHLTALEEHEPLALRALEELIQVDPLLAVRRGEQMGAATGSSDLQRRHARALLAAGRREDAALLGESIARRSLRREDMVDLCLDMVDATTGDRRACWLDRAREAAADHPVQLARIALADARRLALEGNHAGAVELSAPHLDPTTPAAVRLRATTIHAQSKLALGERTEVLSLLDAVPADLGLGSPERALFDSMLGRVHADLGLLNTASVHLARALQRPGLSVLERARLCNNAAIVQFQRSNRTEAIEQWFDALLLFERLDQALECARVRINLCFALVDTGRTTEAIAMGQRAAEIARHHDAHALEAMASGNVVDAALAVPDVALAQRWWGRAWGLATRHELAGEQVELRRRRALIALRNGNANAVELALEAVDGATAFGSELEVGRAAALAAMAYGRAGRATDARESANIALEMLGRAGAANELAEARLLAAETMLLLEERAAAMEHLQRVDMFAAEIGSVHLARRVADLRRQTGRQQGQAAASALLSLQLQIRDADSVDEAIDLVLGHAMDAHQFDVVALVAPNGTVRAAGGLFPEEGCSSSIVQRALDNGRDVVVENTAERRDLRQARSVARLQQRSFVVVPIRTGATVLGALYGHRSGMTLVELRRATSSLQGFGMALAPHMADEAHEGLRKQHAELIDETSRSRERLLATVSHELRTPLHTVLAHATTLQSQPAARQLAEEMIDATGWLVTAVDDMLAYTRGVPLRTQDVDILEEVCRALPDAESLAEERGLTLRVELPASAGSALRCAAGVFEDLTRRLLDNALRFTTEGSVTLSLRLHEPIPGAVALAIVDSGPGIQAALDVTEPFVVGSPPTTRLEGGLGLGLTICKRAVHGLGGQLMIGPRNDGHPGTRVEIRVNLPAGALLDKRTRVEQLGERPDRMLVVDDNQVNLRVMKRIVERCGMEVDIAAGGAEAIALAQSVPYAAVLLDWHMPDIDGLEVARALRLGQSVNRRVPMALVTADASEGVEAAARGAGIDRVAFKPLGPVDVRELVNRLLAHWEQPVG